MPSRSSSLALGHIGGAPSCSLTPMPRTDGVTAQEGVVLIDPNQHFSDFCSLSRTYLDGLMNRGKKELWSALNLTPAHWHPNGFAVFRLAEDHPLGALRLHIWPTHRGPVRQDSPPIHSHAWHLCSRILAGTYRETMYRVGDDPYVGARRHSAKIDYTDAPNDFLPGPPVYIESLDTIECTAGQFHEIPAGIAHETKILDGEFVATLLLTSPPQMDGVMMISSQPIPNTSYHRPRLSQSETRSILRELEAHVWNEIPSSVVSEECLGG